MRDVTTAIILAAGRGSRRLPITRTVDKAMLPMGNRPTVDYVVEECVKAGVRRLVFVVSSQDTLIKKYYGDSFMLEHEYAWLQLSEEVLCEYIVQDDALGYGTAAALKAVEKYVDDEQFIVMPADGFIYSDFPVMSQLVESYKSDSRSYGVLAGLLVSASDASLYSTISYDHHKNLTNLVEKPQNLDGAKNYSANVSYYILHRSIFDVLRTTHEVNGEFYLTDAIVALAKNAPVKVVPIEGTYLDSGQLRAWVNANNILCNNIDKNI